MEVCGNYNFTTLSYKIYHFYAYFLAELLNSVRTKKFYKAARDYVQELLENEHIEGLKHFATKALDKVVMGVWKDYLDPKVQSILRLIVSRDPVGYQITLNMNVKNCVHYCHIE